MSFLHTNYKKKMENNFAQRKFSFFNPKNKKIKKETELSSTPQICSAVKSHINAVRIEAAKISSKNCNDTCEYCEKFEKIVRFSTANCQKEFRWFRNIKYESEKLIRIIDTNGCPYCCACIQCEERITIHRKNVSETPDSSIIPNRRIHSKIELSNETEELIPDVLQLYISLILNSSVKKIVTLLQSTMYLLPEVMFISNGQQENINLEAAQIFGTLKLINDSFCTVICRSYQFEDKAEQKIICLCSCQYKSGNKIKTIQFLIIFFSKYNLII